MAVAPAAISATLATSRYTISKWKKLHMAENNQSMRKVWWKKAMTRTAECLTLFEVSVSWPLPSLYNNLFDWWVPEIFIPVYFLVNSTHLSLIPKNTTLVLFKSWHITMYAPAVGCQFWLFPWKEAWVECFLCKQQSQTLAPRILQNKMEKHDREFKSLLFFNHQVALKEN